jgi:dipeptide transport system substrate-binding protein
LWVKKQTRLAARFLSIFKGKNNMRLSVKKTAWAVLTAITLANTAWAGGTLVHCSEASPTGFDPAQSLSGTDFDAGSRAIFDTLLAYKLGTTELVPNLAEKWTISPDGKTYTFYLRPNVPFHSNDFFKPTRPLQAEDVVFSFGRMIQNTHPSNQLYPATYPYVSSTGLDKNILSVKKIDNLTVEFKLKEVDAPFLSKITIPFAVIHSVEYAQQLARAGRLAELNQKPIGTGPFVFGSYIKDETIRYNANRAYWNADAVKLDKLIFAITKDSAVRVQKLKKGDCDLIAAPNPADLAELKKEPNLKIDTGESLNTLYVAYNTQKAEFKKLEVRQALDMAINRAAILDAVYLGAAKTATLPYPAFLWSHNTAIKNAPTNLTQARALLAKAGYPNGFETDLWVLTSNPTRKLAAELIQADWAKIGVKANLVTFEWGEFLKRLKQGEHPTTLMSWIATYADPDNFLGNGLSCKAVGGVNFAQYCSPAFEALIVKATQTNDLAERVKLYQQAQVIFKHDLPWTTLAHAAVNQPMQKSVQGFKVGAFGEYNFRYVSKITAAP